MSIEVRRVYEDADGGYRVLVDRLWPRGMAKSALELDEWAKEVAPSTELRRWYGHEPSRFDEFTRRYRAELRTQPAADEAARISNLARRRRVVLLTATRDLARSGAEVLREQLTHGRRGRKR